MNEEIRKPYREERPWGEFLEFTKNELSTVKILTVNPNQAFSLQHHNKREEFWRVIEGSGKVTVGNKVFDAGMGSEFLIPIKTNHRIEAGSVPVVVLEISFGEFDEDDIVRVEDKYGRT